jgi:5-methylcytosine-specific restriction enzyme subunit McrC
MLFEYSDNNNLLESHRSRLNLENFLKEIWSKRYFAYAKELEDDLEPDGLDLRNQPFLCFDGSHYRTQNFVGFIQFEEQLIEIYPKVFKDASLSTEDILKHIFYWFSHCRKLHFPVLETSLDSLTFESLPELLIWNFADYCFKTLSTQPFSRYEVIEEALYIPRGKINFPAYIKNGLGTGNYHKIDCIHEPFLFDNTLNRGIKYVCRLLMNISTMKETRDRIEEILFILDEVEDISCSSTDFNKIILSPMFSDYEPIKEWCKRLLDQQLYSSSSYNSMQWSLLLPMEYVFEDFIFGFIKHHFSSYYKIESQKSNYYLADGNVFQLRHDIFLEHRITRDIIIVDTKYKLRQGSDITDKKRGVSQADMYQMLSYAYRRGCEKVIMLYPNSSDQLQEDAVFKIATDFENRSEIEIKICDVPFWSGTSIDELKLKLKNRLSIILGIN